jgi:hypothetical protein
MATFTKQILSGSTNGKSIIVTGTTSGTANTIHTAHSTSIDEIWLYAFNNDTLSRSLTILVDSQEITVVGIPAKEGLVLLLPGLPVTNSLVTKAFADVASDVYICGWVNRIG